jgi:hypothetical protein
MKLVSQSPASVSLIAICAFTGVAARADDGSDTPNRYVVTSLTSDLPGPQTPTLSYRTRGGDVLTGSQSVLDRGQCDRVFNAFTMGQGYRPACQPLGHCLR